MIAANENSPENRRASERFPIVREIRYRVIGNKVKEANGSGRTVNISSGGVLFTADEVLVPGRSVEVSVSWPAQLNAKCGLRLVARGRLVRLEDGRAALQIRKYEFRTESISAEPGP